MTPRPVETEPDLFDRYERPEGFSLSEATGRLSRTVRLRNGRRSARTIVGIPPAGVNGVGLSDLADLTYLMRRRKPRGATKGTPVRVADLFCGCGAMSLGIAEACRAIGRPFEVAGAYDIDEEALRVYADNFGKDAIEQSDLGQDLAAPFDASPKRGELELLERAGRVDIVVAGPPCQGHSNLNNQTRRHDPKNELYLSVARFAGLTGARHVIVENVPTVLHDKSQVVQRTIKALKELGYYVVDGFVNLWELGVPQTRKRHILVASVNEVPSLIEMTAGYRTPARPASWAIEDLLNTDRKDPFDQPSKSLPLNKKRIDYLFDQGLYDLPDHMRPDCHRTKRHSYKAVYGRMHWDRPAQTVTGGFDSMGRGRFVHPSQRRVITPHEAARLQFIPDFFDLSSVGRRRSLISMIANAVPPKLSYAIGLELLR